MNNQGNKRTRSALLIPWLVLSMWLWGPAVASEDCIGVIYPEVREPYRSVLEQIVEGVTEGSPWLVRRHPVREESDVSVPQCRALVGLGRQGLRVIRDHASGRSVVAGAVVLSPGEPTSVPTISLVPDSVELFRRLKHFMPAVQSVTVVFNPKQNGRLVRDAQRAADRLGLDLHALEAKDLRSALVLYRETLQTMDPDTSALWLLQDSVTVDSKNVLPLILKDAWLNRLVTFSSQPAYVKNGVLFSVYPDNLALGRRLGKLAYLCATDGCTSKKVMPLRDLRTAVNVRTADHLRIDFDPRGSPYVDLTFPESRRSR
ncbi:MAG: hypothetical protein GWN09_06995 [Gammaproteobacteria bacterium]|nr:hypothetical protein [Gammaproteobacteria bacterium]